MKTRVISALIGIPLLIGILILGGAYIYIASAIVAVIGYFEFTNANNKKFFTSSLITAFFIPIMFLVVFSKNYSLLPIVFCFLLIFNMTYLVVFNSKETIENITTNVFALFYIGTSFLFLAYIRNLHDGFYLAVPIFLTAFCSDSFAYFVGKAIGKQKLAPVLSPKKTIEGSIGGILGAGLVMGIYAYFYFEKLSILMPNNDRGYIVILFFIFGMIGGGISQIGDLFASAIKRYRNVKDYGKIMPGHGGVLDRFDSVIILSFVFYIIYFSMFYNNYS